MNKKYIVRLTQQERIQLKELVKKGKTQAHRIRHANVLLQADANGPNMVDSLIAKSLNINLKTVENLRKRFVLQGLEAALERKKRLSPPRARLLDGRGEAHLIALSCKQPPKGRAKWTLKLLAEKLICLEIVDDISDQTVRRVLKKPAQAPPAKMLVHPAKTKRRIRRGHGSSA